MPYFAALLRRLGVVGLLSLLSFVPAFGQRLSGTVRDATTNAPIPFASVGVVGQNVGTVADERGQYTFDPAGTEGTAVVRISCIGFTTVQLPLNELKTRGTVMLQPQAHELPTATVKARKLKRYVIGRNATGGAARVIFKLDDTTTVADRVGREAGTIMRLPGNCYLETLRFYVNQNDFRRIKFRLNIYAVKGGEPDTLLVERDVRFDVVDQQTGWIVVDLTPYHLRFDQKQVAVTLQWLTAEGTTPNAIFQMPAAFPAFGHKIIYREKSQSEWNGFPASLSINFTAECGKRE